VPKHKLGEEDKREAPTYNYYWQHKKAEEQAIITDSQEEIINFFNQFPQEMPSKWHFEMR
jgi:hypothetical protein